MRTIFLLSCLVVMASGFQSLAPQVSVDHVSVLRERVSVRIDELPEPVKNTLNSAISEGWELEEAFLVTRDDQSKYYELKLKKDEQRNILQLDREGQPIN